MKNIRQLLRFLKPYKKWAMLAPLFLILEVVMDLMLPTIIANIVNKGIGNNDLTYIIVHVIFMLVLTVVGIAGGLGSVYYASKASQYATADMRKAMFEKISQLSFFHLEQLKTGHLITILTNDITLIGNVIMMGLRILFRVPIILIGSLVMALTISTQLTSILLVIIPIMLLIITVLLKKAFPYFTIIQESVDELNATVRQNLGGIRVVKAFAREQQEKNKFDQVNKHYMDVMIKAMRLSLTVMPVMMLCIHSATIFVLWFGGKSTMNGTMEIGNIMAFIQYLTNILTSLLMASMIVVMTSRSEASAVRMNQIYALGEDFKDKQGAISLEKMDGKIEFKNVSFSYVGGSGDAVLKNINFVIEPGETVAILGSTGSGKSTLVNLIPRFYDVSSGEILVDDVNVKDYQLDYLRRNVAISLQKSILLSGTIKENIKYSNESGTDQLMEEVSKIASAQEFIFQKPEKYEYHVEQGGTNLSGGQKQRLSLARALYANPAVLILDDSTSAVDVKTEKKIRENLKLNRPNQTRIIVAQRITSAMQADKIVILDDGEIVGIGTHQELLKENTIYQDIYQSQLGGK